MNDKKGKIAKRTLAEHISDEPSQAGLAGKYRPLITCIHELTTNSLDAADRENILPNIKIDISEKGENTFQIIHKDNCGGMTPEEAELAFGSYLASSKFETSSTRGQQGIGASSLFTHAYRTTLSPPEIWTSKKGDDKEIHLELNPLATKKEDRLEKEVKEGVSKEQGWTKVQFNISAMSEEGEEGELRFLSKEKSKKGSKNTVYAYIRYLHTANPHMKVEFSPPKREDVENKIFDRLVNEKPEKPESIKPHPHGVMPFDIKSMIEKTLVNNPERSDEKLYEFIQEEFTRTGKTKIKQIKEKAKEMYGTGFDYNSLSSKNIKEIKDIAKSKTDFDYNEMIKVEEENKGRDTLINWLEDKNDNEKVEKEHLDLNMTLEEFLDRKERIVTKNLKSLLDVFKSVDFYKPKKKGLNPIGEKNLKKSVKYYYQDKDNELNFLHYSESKPFIHFSNPSKVEVVIAYGEKTGKDNGPEIVRMANRVPLLYERGSDAIYKTISPTAKDRREFWKYYNINPNKKCTIIVNYVSTRVPFTGLSKSAISPEEDIMKKVKDTVAKGFRKFKTHLRKEKRKKRKKQRAKKLKKYFEVVDELDVLKGLTGRTKKPKFDRIYDKIESSKDTSKIDYSSLVDNSVSEVKDLVESYDNVDLNKVIKYEKDNNNRKTLLEWLKEKSNGGSIDYEDLVDSKVKEIKETVKSREDVDLEKVYELEKDNKNRKTLLKWLTDKGDFLEVENIIENNSVSDIKEKIEDYNLDIQKVLKIEKDNKNRNTLLKWLKRNGAIDYEEIVEKNVGDIKDYVKNNDNIDISELISKEKEINNRKTLLKWLERRK